MSARVITTTRLSLLGSFALEVNGEAVRLPTRKAEALLAFLALHPGVQNRERLAALFWGDSPDELARRSLRTALSALRKELGEDFMLTDRETVQLNPQFSLWVDVYELAQQAKALLSANHHSTTAINIDLYRGDLLQDFYDEWVLEEREHYRQSFINALNHFTQSLKTQGEYLRAIAIAQKIISLDPANERAYQHLMFAYFALDNRTEALKSYEEGAHRFMEYLGVEPGKDTRALYQQIKNADVSATLPSAAKSNLPIPLTSFIGREQELKTLWEIFEATRLLTLTGVGGCGKTRLSIQFASQLMDQFVDGVWWIELAAIQDETALLSTIMKTLGITESQNDAPEESLVKYLQAKHLLLIMDNCEHVIAACARLAETLLSQCPHIKILATSREALSIHGEIAWLVPSLSVPPADQTTDLLQWECPRLFFERATSYRSDLQLNESNSAALLRICRTLEGIPLAIELAAARVKTLSLDQLASRLDDKLTLLTTGSRIAQPRQQTLRAAIDWSYELLTEQEQIALQRLSIFYGTWTLEAAEYICADESIHTSEVLDLITRLLDKSLLITENYDGEIRYRMLEIIRQYAMEKLGRGDTAQRVRDRHLSYYTELTQSVGNAWYSTQQATLLKQFDAHYPNLRVALNWGMENPQRTENWENGLKLAIALVPLWNFRAELNEGSYWLKKAIDEIEIALAESDFPSVKRSELLSLKANAIYETGALSYYLTHHAARTDLFEQAAEIYSAVGDATGLARANLYIAQTASDQGQNDRAFRIWRESLQRFDQTGDRWYAAMTHSFMASTERRLGNYDASEREFQRAIDLYTELGDEWGRTVMFSHLGMISMLRGDAEKARGWFEQRLHTTREIGFKNSVALATLQIGITYWKSGDYALMKTCFLEAIPYFHQIGNYASLADCLIGMAWALAQEGDLEGSAYLLGKVENINQTYGRKVYFEYDFFNQPLCRELLSGLGAEYAQVIEKGKHANLDEIVKDLVR